MNQKKYYRKFLVIISTCLFCLLFGISARAQNQMPIQGTVTNTNGEPVAGVTIQIKNGKLSAVTNSEGKFTIEAQNGETLVFTSIGYVSREISLNGQRQIDVILQNSITRMNEVVVTALGIERQTRALPYTVQQISGSEVAGIKDPGGNIMNSLAGKVANMVVTPAGSGPGGAVKIVLRGNRSINGNNNALLVVDGVPVDNTMSTETWGSGSANTYGTQVKGIGSSYSGTDGSSSLNPEDIESISVLKGPAAAALYGSRAANGALIITTKSGKSGKMSVNYNGGFSVDHPYLLNKFQNSYGRGNGGIAGPTASQSWGPKAQTYPDNVASFYRNGVISSNSVNASGGSENLKGYISYTNNLTNGIIPKNKLNRDNLDLRLTAKILPKLIADAKMTYLNQRIEHLPRLGDQGINNEAYIMPRDLSPDSLRNFETINPVTGLPMPIYWTNNATFANPYWEVNRMDVEQERNRILVMGSLKYNLTNWLSLQGRYSMDRYRDVITGSYYNGTTVNPFNTPGGRYQQTVIDHWERNMDALISGNNRLGADFNINYNVGASVLKIDAGNTTTNANGLSVANKFDFTFASNIGVVHVPFVKEIQSLYGNVQFDYKHLLYLDGSLRSDWSSTLPAPYRFSYPSIGLTGVISDMVSLPGWITFGKVRVAYTRVGNDADPYRTQQQYHYSQGAGNGFISRDIYESISDLKPEQTRSFETGMDWKFFDNRIALDATFYTNNTVNQLVVVGLPAASGFQGQYINVGNIRNSGFELVLSGNPLHNHKVEWNTIINFGLNRNRINSLTDGITQTTISAGSNFGQLIIKPGGSYGDIYGYAWATDPATGQHLINANGLPVATSSNNQKLGNFNPNYQIGWNNNFSYKRFTLSFQIDGRVGGIIVSGTDALMSFYGVSDYTAANREGGLILPGVLADGTPNKTAITSEKLWTTLSNGGRSSGYDQFFAFSATNFRLRQFSLGYNFKLNNSLIRDLRVALTGNNLFFLYRGSALIDIPGIGKRKLPIDPESAVGTSNYQGIESGLPPVVRSIGLTVHMNF